MMMPSFGNSGPTTFTISRGCRFSVIIAARMALLWVAALIPGGLPGAVLLIRQAKISILVRRDIPIPDIDRHEGIIPCAGGVRHH